MTLDQASDPESGGPLPESASALSTQRCGIPWVYNHCIQFLGMHLPTFVQNTKRSKYLQSYTFTKHSPAVYTVCTFIPNRHHFACLPAVYRTSLDVKSNAQSSQSAKAKQGQTKIKVSGTVCTFTLRLHTLNCIALRTPISGIDFRVWSHLILGKHAATLPLARLPLSPLALQHLHHAGLKNENRNRIVTGRFYDGHGFRPVFVPVLLSYTFEAPDSKGNRAVKGLWKEIAENVIQLCIMCTVCGDCAGCMI